jgi:hypothetical protein
MTFLERYQSETTWQGKIFVMEIFHLAKCQRDKDWTITKTASHFECSIGLVSENLRLAKYLHEIPPTLVIQTRQEALKRMQNGRSKASNIEHDD